MISKTSDSLELSRSMLAVQVGTVVQDFSDSDFNIPQP